MHPYKTLQNDNFHPRTGGGICPYCKQNTGWHIRRMGVIPNYQDPVMEQPEADAVTQLERQGYTAAKTPHTPAILQNTCMACGAHFYDYRYNLIPPIQTGYGEHGKGYHHIGLQRIHPYQLPTNLPQPNTDLPEPIRDIFIEAAHIFDHSPRAAAALLRLALQQLLEHCGYNRKSKGKATICNMIAAAVADGLPTHIQQFMDITRVQGNAAAHGNDLTLNPDERRDNAEYLFTVVNTIAEHLLTHPRQAQENYNKLPEAIRAQITKRDTPSQPCMLS